MGALAASGRRSPAATPRLGCAFTKEPDAATIAWRLAICCSSRATAPAGAPAAAGARLHSARRPLAPTPRARSRQRGRSPTTRLRDAIASATSKSNRSRDRALSGASRYRCHGRARGPPRAVSEPARRATPASGVNAHQQDVARCRPSYSCHNCDTNPHRGMDVMTAETQPVQDRDDRKSAALAAQRVHRSPVRPSSAARNRPRGAAQLGYAAGRCERGRGAPT